MTALTYWAMTFDGLPERLSDVRQFAMKILGDEPGVDDVVLILSELAANAICHSASGAPGGTFTVHLATFTDYSHVRVDDFGGSSVPTLGQPDVEDEGSRGLSVVASLARAWGVAGDERSRAVWADVAFPATPVATYQAGDLVRVREEPSLSTIVQPPHQAASELPDDVPELNICCVPVALVRTPTPAEPSGVLRWVEVRDLRRPAVTDDRTPASQPS